MAADARLGRAVDLEERVQLLVRRDGWARTVPAAACMRFNTPLFECMALLSIGVLLAFAAVPPQVDFTSQAVFNYVAQGLFERHKLIVSTQLCMAVLRARGELQRAKFDMLLRGPKVRCKSKGVEHRMLAWVLPPQQLVRA